MKFLIQDWSKRIYVRTDALAQRKDMSPYEWPGPESKEAAPPKPKEAGPETPGDYCKRVFGKHLSKVTKVDILAHAGKDFDLKLSKPEMLELLMTGEV